MEYSTIFGKFDWDAVRHGKFHGKSGNFMTIARIIYNGMSYNFGSKDGAVTMSDQLTRWKFIAPVGRFDMTDYAESSLVEALRDVMEDVENAPVPAWDEFFAFLGGKEELVNASVQAHVVRIGGVKVDLPFIGKMSTFAEFMGWLTDNIGEAGNLAASEFIEGQDMTIPMEEYNALLKAVTLKTPDRVPIETDIQLLDGVTYYASYTTLSGTFNTPVFLFTAGSTTYLYAFNYTTDANGKTITKGWYMTHDSATGISYTPYDMDAYPVTVTLDGKTVLKNYQAKLFMDIEFDETTEVLDGCVYYVFRA